MTQPVSAGGVREIELARADERRAAVVIDPVCRMQVAIDRAALTDFRSC